MYLPTIQKKYFLKKIRTLEQVIPLRKPTRKELLLLKLSWFNPGYSASVAYLIKMFEFIETCNGSILECGSGISTILGGIAAKEKKLEMTCLEHRDESYNRVRNVLSELHLTNVNLMLSPLEDYGDFAWYDVKGISPHRIGFVSCDGPPWFTKGGRYGLLPLMLPFLANDCTILLDDADRKNEQQAIKKWRELVDFDCNLMGFPFRFAEITIGGSS